MSYRANARLMIIGALVVVACSTANGASTAFRSDSEFDQWMQNYYRSPSPDRLLGAFNYYSASTMYGIAHARLPIAQFFASAYGEDPAALKTLVEAVTSNPASNPRMFALRVLWLADSESSRSLLKQVSDSWRDKNVQALLLEIGDRRPKDLLSQPVQVPAELDMLWSMFFATGDRRPIERLVVVLPLLKEGHGLDIAFGGAAKWSLESNAARHETVLAILEELSPQATGVTKELLQEIIRSAGGKPDTAPNPSPAACAPARMVRVVFRDVTPGVDAGSFAAQPKTLYRLGTKYGRAEEALDSANGIHGLIVVNEPDLWAVNLATKTGQHSIDPDKPGQFRAAIVGGPGTPEVIRRLEFGCEFEYLKALGLIGHKSTIDGAEVDQYEVIAGSNRVVVSFRTGTPQPMAYALYEQGKLTYDMRYVEYDTTLEPRISLFDKPQGISIEEAK
jgi:hypothetical protein